MKNKFKEIINKILNKFKWINEDVLIYFGFGLVTLIISIIILSNSHITFFTDIKNNQPIITLIPTIVIKPTLTMTLLPASTPIPTSIPNTKIVGKGFFGWYDESDPNNRDFICPDIECPNLDESHTYYICATGTGINSNFVDNPNETLYIIRNEVKEYVAQFYPVCVVGKYKLTTLKIGYLSENIRRALFPFNSFPILNIEIYDSVDGKPIYPIYNIAVSK